MQASALADEGSGLLNGKRRGGMPVALQAAMVMAGGLAISFIFYHTVRLSAPLDHP